MTDVIGAYNGESATTKGNLFYDSERPEDHPWELCIIDKSYDVFGNADSFYKKKATNPGTSGYLENDGIKSHVKEIYAAVIEFEVNGRGVLGTDKLRANISYFTKKQLYEDYDKNKGKVGMESFSYLGLPIYGDKKTVGTDTKYINKNLFFFVVSGDHFCLVTVDESTDADWLENSGSSMFKMGVGSLKKSSDNKNFDINPLKYLDVGGPFCNIPENNDFKGKKSCYYYGCEDVDKSIGTDEDELRVCRDIFNACPGLCMASEDESECYPCSEIKRCEDYKTKNDCQNNMCGYQFCAWSKTKCVFAPPLT